MNKWQLENRLEVQEENNTKCISIVDNLTNQITKMQEIIDAMADKLDSKHQEHRKVLTAYNTLVMIRNKEKTEEADAEKFIRSELGGSVDN
jgi:hypothetical protein